MKRGAENRPTLLRSSMFMIDATAKQLIRGICYVVTACTFFTHILEYSHWSIFNFVFYILTDMFEFLLIKQVWITILTFYIFYELKQLTNKWIMIVTK